LKLVESKGKPPIRRAFDDYLRAVKRLYKRLKLDKKIFISYAWEKAGSEEIKQLHSFLTILQSDLEAIGFEVFLDIEKMTGNIVQQMQEHITTANTVLLISTPLLKTRCQDNTTNIFFEVNLIREKRRNSSNVKDVITILRTGDFETSIPQDFNKILCMDFRDDENYVHLMTQLSNPVGLIPTLLDLENKQNKDSKKDYEITMNLFKKHVDEFTKDREALIAKYVLTKTLTFKEKMKKRFF